MAIENRRRARDTRKTKGPHIYACVRPALTGGTLPLTSPSPPPSNSPGCQDPAPRRLSPASSLSWLASLSPSSQTRCDCNRERDRRCARVSPALCIGRGVDANLDRPTPASKRPSCDRVPLSTGPRTFLAVSELSLNLRRSSWWFLFKRVGEERAGRGGGAGCTPSCT